MHGIYTWTAGRACVRGNRSDRTLLSTNVLLCSVRLMGAADQEATRTYWPSCGSSSKVAMMMLTSRTGLAKPQPRVSCMHVPGFIAIAISIEAYVRGKGNPA